MKYFKKYQEEILQLTFIIIPIFFLFIAISYNSVFNRLLYWLFVLTNDIFITILVYFLFFSFALTMIFLYRSRRKNLEFLSQKNVAFYKKLIVSTALIVLFSMLILTIFSSKTYSIRDFLIISIQFIVVFLIVYIPSLFFEIIEGNHILSFIYFLITHFTIQLIFFIPIYMAYFIPGV